MQVKRDIKLSARRFGNFIFSFSRRCFVTGESQSGNKVQSQCCKQNHETGHRPVEYHTRKGKIQIIIKIRHLAGKRNGHQETTSREHCKHNP